MVPHVGIAPEDILRLSVVSCLSVLNKAVTNFGIFALDTIFPVDCIKCGRGLSFDKNYVCANCDTFTKKPLSFLCPVCEARIPEGKICRSCRRKTELKRFFNAGHYTNSCLRELIHQFKYQRVKVFSGQLAKFIIKAIKDNKVDKTILKNKNDFATIPVPLHKKKLRERGFNQSEEIAKHIAQEFWLTLLPGILVRTVETEPQAEIQDTKKRKENVKNCFVCKNAETIKNKTVILIDDVYTTGSTMEECARVLKKAGAKEIWGMVIAKG